MARKPRFENLSEGNYYHVTARGSGRRVLFEDDIDRSQYLQMLFEAIDDSSGTLVAWCLMENHVHLLFHLDIHEVSSLMHRLHTKFGQYYNGRHGHVGPVFQGRFDSVPVLTDEQLIQTVRYIHWNPRNTDCPDWRSYRWSSYRNYTNGLSHCETNVVLGILGGANEFERFHQEPCDVHVIRTDGYRMRLSDAEGADILRLQLGPHFADKLVNLPKSVRDHELVIAYKKGLSVRQIERLTGIGRNIVQRAIAS